MENFFVAINVNTQGISDKISIIKIFTYVTSNKGYLYAIDYSSNNFILPVREKKCIKSDKIRFIWNYS
ncbi:MAG: hypothetical protein Ct9H90mP28_5900 [Paracoccaceae bacterium]|nr:MAG: hypothetical protein Ct9H90mP28_5900 [Paracoccaceae bacterium]